MTKVKKAAMTAMLGFAAFESFSPAVLGIDVESETEQEVRLFLY